MVSEDVFRSRVAYFWNGIFPHTCTAPNAVRCKCGDIGRSCIVVFRDSLSAARIGGV
jgi:hypothetical protein